MIQLGKSVNKFREAQYAYGIIPPEHFLFLKEADGYIPWCLYKLQSQGCNIIKYATVLTHLSTSNRYNIEMNPKRQSFMRDFEYYFFDYDLSASRDSKQIIGKGVFMSKSKVIDCLAVVKKDTKIGVPIILVSEDSQYCNMLSKAVQKGYLDGIKVCKPKELTKFIYRVPSIAPIKVCKILNDYLN